MGTRAVAGVGRTYFSDTYFIKKNIALKELAATVNIDTEENLLVDEDVF